MKENMEAFIPIFIGFIMMFFSAALIAAGIKELKITAASKSEYVRTEQRLLPEPRDLYWIKDEQYKTLDINIPKEQYELKVIKDDDEWYYITLVEPKKKEKAMKL